jgi:cell division septum initiation protein DivIVA
MDDARNTKKIHPANSNRKRPKRRTKARWKGDIQNGIRKMAAVNWGEVAQDIKEWKTVTRAALIFLG